MNGGSVVDIVSQAVAQEDFALYYQIAQVSRLSDLEALTGQDLDDKAFEYGITRKSPAKTKGKINILRASTFVKVSTTFYAGSPAKLKRFRFADRVIQALLESEWWKYDIKHLKQVQSYFSINLNGDIEHVLESLAQMSCILKSLPPL